MFERFHSRLNRKPSPSDNGTSLSSLQKRINLSKCAAVQPFEQANAIANANLQRSFKKTFNHQLQYNVASEKIIEIREIIQGDKRI